MKKKNYLLHLLAGLFLFAAATSYPGCYTDNKPAEKKSPVTAPHVCNWAGCEMRGCTGLEYANPIDSVHFYAPFLTYDAAETVTAIF